MHYLIHASLLLAGCFVYYWLLLRSETHFKLNRWVLLGCLVGSLTLPLVTVPAAWSLREQLTQTTEVEEVKQPELAAEPTTVREKPLEQREEKPEKPILESSDEPEVNESSAIPTPTKEKTSITNVPKVSASIDWWKTLWWVYLAGVLIFGVNFLIQFGQLVMRLVRYPGHDLGAYRLVELSEDAAPYSFWNRIFLNPDRYDPDTFHQIFQHEQIHVTQKHSIDLLLAELLVVFQWFNPFAWLYRKAIEDNLEFLTDAEMLRIGNDPERYQLSLVKVAVPNFPNGLVASYNQNFLEKRIAMMKTKKSSLRSGWKYLTLLPLLLISVLQFNAIAQTPAPSAPPAAPVATTVTSVPVLSPAPAAAPVATPMAAPMPMPVPAPVPNVNPAPVPQVVLAPQASPVFHHVPVPQMAGDADFREMRDFNSWTAVIERPDICFQFISRSRANDNNFNYQSSRCFPLSSFSDLPQEEMGEFYLKRESGTMTFKGMFEDDQGVGNFSFNPDAGFVSKLQGMGYSNFKDRELWMLFLADMNGEYLSYLKSAGYSPSEQKLIELSIFYDDLDELKDRVAMLDRMGYDKPKLSKLIELQIHGVDDGYVADLSSAGFDDLGVNDLVKAKIHGLSSRFVTEMNQMGFRNLSFDRLTELAIHGVSTEYVNELKDLGYTDLSPKEVLEAKIHGVSTERIAEFQKAGFTDLTLNEAKQMTIHGVDADLVRGLAEFGFTDLTVDEVVGAKIHGVSERRLRDFKATGLEMTSLKQLQNAFIHGVNPDQVKAFRDLGYTDLDLKDFVQARIHGVSPEFASSFREVGFDDIPLKKLVNLRIHGVSADYIKKWDRDDLDLDDYVKMKIHGIRPAPNRNAQPVAPKSPGGWGVARVTADAIQWSTEDQLLYLKGKVKVNDDVNSYTVTGTSSYPGHGVDAVLFNGQLLTAGETIDVSGKDLRIEIVQDATLARKHGLQTSDDIAVIQYRD